MTVDQSSHILQCDSRIILPSSLISQAIKIAHEGHQGIAKTIALLREYVWLLGLGKSVQAELNDCLACQAMSQSNPPEPLRYTPMPNRPREEVKIDFCGPFPLGHYLLTVIDTYSRFPEVEILRSISADKVIPKLDEIFARHGIPKN